MKTNLKISYWIAAVLLVFASSCHKDHVVRPSAIAGKYDNGFFIINEGWYQHASGSVSFFDYSTGTITDSVFTKENPGKTFDPNTANLEFGTVYKGKLYLLCKYGGPIVIADASSLKETGRIDSSSNNDWRAFVGVDDSRGLVGSGDGLYQFNLQTVKLGAKISGISGETGDMVKAGNYIFVLTANDGIDILNASDYSIAKKIPDLTVGFAVTPDGSVWAAGNTSLAKINPTNLTVSTVTLPFTVSSTWGFWHPGSITASSKDNSVFVANPAFSGPNTIYKYVDGNAASLATPLITIASTKILYGKSLAFNASTGQLVVNTIPADYSAGNDLDFYDAGSGSLVKDISYGGFFFPSTVVFH